MSEKNDRETNYDELNGEAGRVKVAELIKGSHIVMFTTVAEDGTMSSRPMAVQNKPFDGSLWFLTRSSSDKVDELTREQHVMLTFAEPKDSRFLALKGVANVSQDRSKIHELWSPIYKAWFPKGEDDPDIAVIQVVVQEGDFWEASSSRIVRITRYLAAAITGGSVTVGDAGHIST